MKKLSVFLVGFLFIISCANSAKEASTNNAHSMVEFTEERKLNHSADLPEVVIVNSLEELTSIYRELKDPDIPKSAPIPSFDPKNETILVLKPQLKDFQYADVEIVNIREEKNNITIDYKEVENWEYTENKWSDPILIIKVQGKPKTVTLKK